MDGIILKENNKLSAEDEAHGNIDYEINENCLYKIINMSLGEKKSNTLWRKHAFESELENTYEIEIQNGITCIHGKNLK